MSAPGNNFGLCALYNSTTRNDNIFNIANSYGGIPQNLITNLIVMLILVALFILLRKSAWKLVNRIVRKDDMDRWTQLFFSFTTELGATIDHGARGILRGQSGKRKDPEGATHESDGSEAIVSKSDDEVDGADGIEVANDHDRHEEEDTGEDHEASDSFHDEKPEKEASDKRPRPKFDRQLSLAASMTFWQWLKSIFTASDQYIFDKCGDDALQYLRFQRHIIFYLMIVMVLAICVVLPLNFQGTLYAEVTSFEHTTLANLDPNSDLLWVHLVLSFFFFPVAILVMRKFSIDLKFTQVSLEISHTLMIENIPKMFCRSNDEILRHFEEAYSKKMGEEITDIRFAYNVSKLQPVSESLKQALASYGFCLRNQRLGKPDVTLYDVQCSRCCSCFCCCCVNKEDGLEFYREEKEKFSQEFAKERALALKDPLGIAFITFKTLGMSKDVYDSFQRSVFDFNYRAPESSLSSILKPNKWRVTFAPEPNDIYWENLSVSGTRLRFTYIAVNIAVFIFALFLTTPEVLFTQVNNISAKLNLSELATLLQLPSWIVDFIPTLMVWGFTALLPLLVSWSDRYLGHWTRSVENHSIMKKTYWYLLFMVVLLPTFGFTSAQAGIEFFFNSNSNSSETYRWECIFLPDSGAFFVNYAVTAALAGAGFELIRLPELLWYAVQLCWSRSAAESPYIRDSIKYEFRFGEQYARIMMLFTMTIMYSMSCPIITPFGALFFITKHYVDRHNLMYAYKRSKISKKVHSTAISFVILSTVILQFFMMIFSLIRSGNFTFFTPRSKVSIGFFLVSVNVFLAQQWADTCRKFSPVEYVECIYIKDDVELDISGSDKQPVYLPETLMTDEEKEDLRQKRVADGEARDSSAIHAANLYGTFASSSP